MRRVVNYWLYEIINPIFNEARKAGIILGNEASQNALSGFAPSIIACSSSSGPRARVASVIIVMQ